MPSTDTVSSITNCYRLIVSYSDPVHSFMMKFSSRNAQLSQLGLVCFVCFSLVSILVLANRSSYHLYLFTYLWEVFFIIKHYFFTNAIHPAFVISDQWNGSDLSGVSITGTSVSGNLIQYQSVHITVVQSEPLFTCDNIHSPKSSDSNGTISKQI